MQFCHLFIAGLASLAMGKLRQRLKSEDLIRVDTPGKLGAESEADFQ